MPSFSPFGTVRSPGSVMSWVYFLVTAWTGECSLRLSLMHMMVKGRLDRSSLWTQLQCMKKYLYPLKMLTFHHLFWGIPCRTKLLTIVKSSRSLTKGTLQNIWIYTKIRLQIQSGRLCLLLYDFWNPKKLDEEPNLTEYHFSDLCVCAFFQPLYFMPISSLHQLHHFLPAFLLKVGMSS